jgi:cytochrome P450
MAVREETGIEATFDPIDMDTGLADDPDLLVAAIMEPDRRGELYPLYRQLRAISTLHRTSYSYLNGAWIITGFAEAEAVYRNPYAIEDPDSAEVYNHSGGAFYETMRRMMLFLAPEEHARTRRLVVRAFTPRAIGLLQPVTQAIADGLLDAVEGDGGMDFVDQYAYRLPIAVIARILGVPDADLPVIGAFAWDFARAGEKSVSAAVARRGDEAAEGLQAYFGDLVARRRATPGDDIVSELIVANEDGQHLTPEEIVATCILLLQAGHETTTDLLGNSLVALFRHPAELERLRADPGLTKPAVEELLRYDGSVQIGHRILRGPVPAGDVVLAEGEHVFIFLGAANRDPRRFAEPDRLDLTRVIDHHLAFAFGAYYCIGNALARTETQIGLRAVLDRFPRLRPAGASFQWRDTLQLRGPLKLEVTW